MYMLLLSYPATQNKTNIRPSVLPKFRYTITMLGANVEMWKWGKPPLVQTSSMMVVEQCCNGNSEGLNTTFSINIP
uniref:Uncharacterized protein n=1 Tax=Anguilla anguilla TaxID=7936 RepID=A0A0E9TJW4_ANGAN